MKKFLLLGLLISLVSWADEDQSSYMEEVFVTGGAQAIKSLAGSASLVDLEAIKEFDVTDLTGLLSQVPGVYIRFEDGYGLRPNIGIRGATSDRSQKVTLMEDGILIAPSPYAAPAAYYVPNVNRMEAVEVFKGPAAIKYGPHTVGGALNMVTRLIPEHSIKEISLSAGTDAYRKARLFWSESFEQTGFWFDALSYGADGFKELANGNDTGFERNDLNVKWRWKTPSSASVQHIVDVKLGYADEVSDETYLGVSDLDFTRNPVQRYAASELDQFNSEHTQVHLLHQAKLSSSLSVNNKLYLNRFDRTWNRFDGFYAPPSVLCDNPTTEVRETCGEFFIQDILASQDNNSVEIQLLRGERDSNGSSEQTIRLVDNAREYGSQGIETGLSWQFDAVGAEHVIDAGIRWHNDYVDRNHTQIGYLMRAGRLVFDGVIDRERLDWNRSEVDAIAAYLSDEIRQGKFKFNLGVRVENIEGRFTDFATATSNESSETVAIPGFGTFYQHNQRLGFLLGINKGFSPSGPTASNLDAESEESTNIEYGFRYDDGRFTLNAIGFFSDYSNLLGRCRASDPGCIVGQEFNGGEVEISGLELTASHFMSFDNGWLLPVNLTYTYTEAYFQSSFISGFSQWGVVQEGDELPYTPNHQARLQLALQSIDWSLVAVFKYLGDMREVPAQGRIDSGLHTKAYTVVDVSARYAVSDQLELNVIAENIADEQQIVARRPFGARPNHPRVLKLGVSYSF